MNLFYKLLCVLPLFAMMSGLSATNQSSNSAEEQPPEFLYKVIVPKQWMNNEEVVELGSEDIKFIHLATSDQVTDIILKYFGKKASSIWILKLDVSKLPGRLVLEANPGGKTLYYHLYDGSIPKAAVVEKKAVGFAF